MATFSQDIGEGRRKRPTMRKQKMHDASTDTVHPTTPPQPSSTAEQRDNDTSSLRDHLESLPQELYDEIYDLTFTAESARTEVTTAYRFPNRLYVSRATRQYFSTSYFKSVFHFSSLKVLLRWSICLDEVSFAMLRHISLPYPPSGTNVPQDVLDAMGSSVVPVFRLLVGNELREAGKDGAVVESILEFVDV